VVAQDVEDFTDELCVWKWKGGPLDGVAET